MDNIERVCKFDDYLNKIKNICIKGDLNEIKKIINYGNINLIFVASCANGHLDVVKYLIGSYKNID